MRALYILNAQLRMSLMLALQYRMDFLLDIVVELFWTATAIFPLLVVFQHTQHLGGWTFAEALAFSGVFSIFQGLMEAVISPSLGVLLEQVKKGTFDFVLLKPFDSQFLASTTKLQPWRTLNVLVGMLLLGYAARHTSGVLSLARLGLFALTLCAGVALFYSLWITLASAVFLFQRLDNLTYLLVSIFDVGRWPRSAFRGALRFVFTFVLPIAVMTSFPAEALLGTLSIREALSACAAALLALLVSRVVWTRAVARYGSASS
jgi:ABC-2 type transport system permease protein